MAALLALCLLSIVALSAGGFWLAREANARASAEAKARRLAEAEEQHAHSQAREATQRAEVAQGIALKSQRRHYAGQIQRVQAEANATEGVAGARIRFLAEAEKTLADLLPGREVAEDLRGFEWYYLQAKVRSEKPRVFALQGHTGRVSSIAFSPDGQRVATSGRDQTVRVWDAKDGKELRILRPHAGSVFSVTFSPDGSRLLSGGSGSEAQVWDVATGKDVKDLPVATAADKVFSPDGRFLAAVSDKDAKVLRVAVWDVKSGKQVTTVTAPAGKELRLGLAPGGRSLLVCEGGRGQLWDVTSGKRVASFPPLGEEVRAVAFAPSGKLCAAGGDQGVRVWYADTGKPAVKIQGHPVLSLAFSPDGKRLATGGPDKVVRLWDVMTGVQLLDLKAADPVPSLSFSPDGLQLVAGSDSGPVQVWDAHPKP